MTPADRFGLAALGQPLQRVLPDRLQHRVARLAAAGSPVWPRPQQALLDQ